MYGICEDVNVQKAVLYLLVVVDVVQYTTL